MVRPVTSHSTSLSHDCAVEKVFLYVIFQFGKVLGLFKPGTCRSRPLNSGRARALAPTSCRSTASSATTDGLDWAVRKERRDSREVLPGTRVTVVVERLRFGGPGEVTRVSLTPGRRRLPPRARPPDPASRISRYLYSNTAAEAAAAGIVYYGRGGRSLGRLTSLSLTTA